MGVISCQSQLGKRGYALIIHIYIYIYLYQASNSHLFPLSLLVQHVLCIAACQLMCTYHKIASNSHHEDDSNFLVENPELNLDLLMTFLGGV